MERGEKIIFFDGHCNLCNSIVKFIIAKDRKKIFKFAALQSQAAERLFPEKEKPETIYFWDGFRLSSRSEAALRIFKHLGFPWNLTYILIVFPKPLRDLVYKVISKNRYRWFGSSTACMRPTPELRNRFLA